jgi:heparin binding hemagglutinin HbhA
MTESVKEPTVTKSLYATVGAGDALYTAANDLLGKVRERAAFPDVTGRVEEARERFSTLPADAQERFESFRSRLTGLSAELPDDLAELRDKMTPEELRKLADQYYHQLLDLYQDLASRGEETVGRLRSNSVFEERFERVEGIYTDVVSRAEDVIGKVSGLLGTPGDKTGEPVVDAEVVQVTTEAAPADEEGVEALAKKAPAKKAPAKKTTTAAKK